jgi:bifunctional DNase/RNase
MPNMVEVVIDSIRVGLMSQQRVVILREVDAERYLAIWIDPYMAEQITFALQEVEVARPMTHDLMRELLHTMDARVIRVEVLSLKGDVFYGNIVVEANDQTIDIDSRPSDALALAVRAHVPILVSDEVMQSAGIVPEDDLEEDADQPNSDSPVEERLEVFEDFLDNLEIDNDEEGDNSGAKNN